ncbi:MAG: YihY/virulence factor BrkB family protein [bacterium]
MFQLYKNIKEFFKHYLGGLYHRIGEHHVFLLGGGLAFSILVCVVPFVLIIFSLLGSFLKGAAIQQQLDTFIDTVIPYARHSDFLKKVISSRMEEMIAYKNIAGYSGIIGLFIGASGLFSSMRTILNTLYKVQADVNIVIGKLRDFGMVLAVMVFFLVAVALLPMLNILGEYVGKMEFLKFLIFVTIENSLFSLFSFFIMFLLFFFLYYFVPYQRFGKKVTAVSAFWAAALWEIAAEIFGYYISHVASVRRVYGAYALVVVVIFWIYYSSVVFILAAEIGQLYRERSAKLMKKTS